MVFINKKYGVRSLNGPLSDEAAKNIHDLMNEKEESSMTQKIFTEDQYKKITDCFDGLKKHFSMGLLNCDVLSYMQGKLFDEVDFINDWQEIAAIANPATREEAKEKYVEKEKKYFWELTPLFDDDDRIYLTECKNGIIQYTTNYKNASCLTESNIRKWGYNPDMFDKEEVE